MPTIKAHFDGRTIVPDEPLNLTQGQPLVVHFEPAPENGPPRYFGKHFLDWVVENLVARTNAPSDAGVQHDHYLYRTPKRDV